MSTHLRLHPGVRAMARALGVADLPHKRVEVHRDLPVPMRDGTTLLANRWMPSGRVEAPLVLIRTPYGRKGLQGTIFGRLLAHQGFQVVLQSCRGTDGSGGSFDDPFRTEVPDGADTVQWLRQQSWYPGSFATAGGSYVGYTQLALAQAAPEEHRAAVLSATPLTVRDIAWPYGLFSPSTALLWSAQVTSGDPAAGVKGVFANLPLPKKVRQAALAAPLQQSYLRATGKPVGFLEQWMHAEDPDHAAWPDLDQSAALDVLRGPVLVQAGWYDVFLESSLRQYTHLRERGVDVRLTVGPWTHAGVGLKALPDMITFLREVLLDGPASGDGAPVRIIDIGGKHPQHLSEWPDDVPRRTYHLTAGRLLDDRGTTGARSSTFVFDPTDPTPNIGGATLELQGGGAQDNRKVQQRPDVLTFDSDPLPAACTLRGSVRIALTLSSDRPATCLFLRLCDLAEDGTSTNVTDTMVSLHHNEARTWKIEAELPPTSVQLPAGHRLRLHVASGAFPRFLPHSGTAEDQTAAAHRVPAHQTIYHDATHPATVSVPFLAR